MSAANPNNNQPAYSTNTPPPATPPYNPYNNPYNQPYPQYSTPPAAAPTPIRKPWYAQWWVWAICVLAVAAIAVGITLAVTSSQPAKVTIQPADLPDTTMPGDTATPQQGTGLGSTDGTDSADGTGATGEDTGSASGSQMAEIRAVLEKYADCRGNDDSDSTWRNLECKVVGNVLQVTMETDDASEFDLTDVGFNYAEFLSARIWHDIHQEEGIERFSVLVCLYGENGNDLRGSASSDKDLEQLVEKYNKYMQSANPNTH